MKGLISLVVILVISLAAAGVTHKDKGKDNVVELIYPEAQPRNIELSSKAEDIAVFQPAPLHSKSRATYHLSTKLDVKGVFANEAVITVENLSEEEWNELVFYFIPNVFTDENQAGLIESSAEVKIEEVSIDGEITPYALEQDTLLIKPSHVLVPSGEAVIHVRYSFTVPEGGIRFAYEEGNYYLAQWYPMLATYQSGWVKEDYTSIGESYHTSFSDFSVSYELPEEYFIMSSASDDPVGLSKAGTLTLESSKEFFLALTKNAGVKTAVIDGVEIRAAASQDNEENLTIALTTAQKAFQFFHENISPYPHKQLDIIVDQAGMEYPGIVTISNGVDQDVQSFKHTVVHEVAHQWFYGAVSSNPYDDTWLDEGMAEFATTLYFMELEGQSPEEALPYGGEQIRAHMPLTSFNEDNYGIANYGNPARKLWELSGDVDHSLAYLNRYAATYTNAEVDTQEWIRFTKAFFRINDNSFFTDWIQIEP